MAAKTPADIVKARLNKRLEELRAKRRTYLEIVRESAVQAIDLGHEFSGPKANILQELAGVEQSIRELEHVAAVAIAAEL